MTHSWISPHSTVWYVEHGREGGKHDSRWVLTIIEQDICWVHAWVNTYIKERLWDTVGLLQWLSSHMCKHKLIKPCAEHWGGGWGGSSDEIMTCEKFNLGYFCVCMLLASRSSVTSAPPPTAPPHRPRLHSSVQQIQRAGTLLVKHLLKAGWKSQQRLQQPVSVSGLPPAHPLHSYRVKLSNRTFF